MNTLWLLKRATLIALTQPSLWLLGVLLSSGFNLHIWYAISNLLSSSQAKFWTNLVLDLPPLLMYSFLTVGLFVVVFVVNSFKLLFLTKLHKLNHVQTTCPYCLTTKDLSLLQIFRANLIRLWRMILASSLTLIATTGLLLLYKFYLIHSDDGLVKSLLLVISLVVIGMGISLWNLFTAVFVLWYGQTFSRAAGLSIEFLFGKIATIVKNVMLATVIFLAMVSLGMVVVSQIPQILQIVLSFPFGTELYKNFQNSLFLVSVGLFGFWLVVNNVWFNVMMVLLFDYSIRLGKTDLPAIEKSAEPVVV